jgi:outer membrane immunogenic protein
LKETSYDTTSYADSACGTQIGVGPQGGFVLGYKYQAPNSPWVFGIDGQFSFADLQGSTSNSNSVSAFFPKFTVRTKSFRTCEVNVNHSINVSSKVKDIATIAVVFGITSGPQDLRRRPTGTRPIALTGRSGSSALGGIHPEDSGTAIARSYTSADKNRWGWMVGTGVEFGLWGNWSAKIEYDFLDFGSYDVALNGTASAAQLGFNGRGTSFPCTGSIPFSKTLHVDQQIHLVQVGLKYKFDWANWGHW